MLFKIAAVLLVLTGVIQSLPNLNDYLLSLTGGIPVVQVALGVFAVLVGVGLLTQDPAPAKSTR